MNFNFSKIIDEIENEIQSYYIPGAIAFIDKTHGNAWSNTIDQFEKAMAKAVETQDFSSLETDSLIYKNSVLEFIRIYKRAKREKRVDEFFKSLQS